MSPLRPLKYFLFNVDETRKRGNIRAMKPAPNDEILNIDFVSPHEENGDCVRLGYTDSDGKRSEIKVSRISFRFIMGAAMQMALEQKIDFRADSCPVD